MIYDTICAIATPYGTGGISVIRVSGTDSIMKINEIFKGNNNLLNQKSHTVSYGFIMDGNKVIDEVLVTIFRAPKSFTMEDVVEISTHGGILVTRRVLSKIISLGIRLAERGEFSKRAYLNGRIDLIQAEAINDLISAKNENAMKIAFQGMNKDTSNKINSLKEEVLEIIAKIEVNIDYPEYDDAIVMTSAIIIPELITLIEKMKHILNNSLKTKMIKEGIKTAIIGKPNVGKSSLLNAILEEDKAIVTNIEGTTRDLVEASINIGGITLNLIDTAGIRKTDDTVEKLGIERSKKAISEAELILLVIDQSVELTESDHELLQLTNDKRRIIVLNKSDLDKKTTIDNAVSLSSLNKEGIDILEERIIETLSLTEMENDDFSYLSNARQIGNFEEAIESLENALQSARNDMPVDLYVIDITNAYRLILQILGEEYQDNLINELFSKFCLGK